MLVGQPKANNQRTTTSYYIRIRVKMSHEPTIQKLGDMFGCLIKFVHESDPKRKHNYEFAAITHKAEAIIRRLLPYLVTKKEQAELALEYYSNHQEASDEVKLSYFERLKEMNRKGK